MGDHNDELSFVAEGLVPHAPDRVFAWHERPGAFARLSPPWEATQVLAREGTIRDGDRLVMKVPLGPLGVEWEARHFGFQPGIEFNDEQVRGPFASWRHRHQFRPAEGGTLVEDSVRYALPAGALGRVFGRDTVEKRLHRMFAYRHAALAADLERHANHQGPPLRVLVAGASGLVGSALCAFLSTGGHEVLRLVRPKSSPPADAVGTEVPWDPTAGHLDHAGLGPVDAVVNLAGENVGDGRWTEERKRRMRGSRVDLTRFLAAQVARMNPRPKVMINASAMGLYGERGDEPLTEDSPAGEGFLAQMCLDWEAATSAAQEAGVRVVLPRIGLVLSPHDGVLGKMLPVFRAGLGGKLGKGSQWMSWIALDDLVGVIHAALIDARWSGPINAAAPEPVTNGTFTDTLGRVLGRPTVLPVPAMALKLAFGEMGEMAMASVRMLPGKLQTGGFRFRFRSLEAALETLLGRGPLPPLETNGKAARVSLMPLEASGPA